MADREKELKALERKLADDKHKLEYYKKCVDEVEHTLAATPSKIAALKKEAKMFRTAALAAKK